MADTNPSALPSSAKAEFPCPDCGEMVREGLVRCWNCGGFLRPEMEQQFHKMQSQPQKVILSAAPAEAEDTDIDAMMSARVAGGEGDDFQISTPLKQGESPTVSGGESEATAEAQPTEGTAAASEAKDDTADSAGTSGDALLELAAAEEQEQLKRRGDRPATLDGVKVIRDGFLIDAPKGCRIQVRDERTGEMRRLTFGASSRVRISMLDKLEAIAKAKKEAAAKEAAGPKYVSAGKYQRWMSDIHMHTINPAKLKLVADSLTKEFVPVEVGFAEDELLLVSLPGGKKGLFGGGKGPGTAEDARKALLDHLRAGKSLEGEKVEVAGDVNAHFTSDQMAEIRAVQPAASLSESLFAGIPVFGEGRIAVQMPVKEAGELPKVLSFTLSQFREFLDIIGQMYSLAEFGHNLGIPLVDSFEDHKCHYTGDTFKALQQISFYSADPELETVLAGYKCDECGIAVSETAREKEKLGGKGGKGIAKAKCPKCEKKMGNVPLYTLASTAEQPSAQEGDGQAAPDDVTDQSPAVVASDEQPSSGDGETEPAAQPAPAEAESKPEDAAKQ